MLCCQIINIILCNENTQINLLKVKVYSDWKKSIVPDLALGLDSDWHQADYSVKVKAWVIGQEVRGRVKTKRERRAVLYYSDLDS